MNRPSHALPAALDSAPLPEVINHTQWPSQYFQHVDPLGEIFHVMVSRVSYSLSEFGSTATGLPLPTLLGAHAQVPLCEADEFYGALNATSVLQESDYAPYKPKCDVLLLNAVAQAPGDQPLRRWPVGFRLGSDIHKVFQVTGPRVFERSVSRMGIMAPTEPEPATQVPLRYERAYGGPNLVAQAQVLTEISEGERGDPANAQVRRAARDWLERLPERQAENPIGCGRAPQSVIDIDAACARLACASLSTAEAQRRIDDALNRVRPAPQIEVLNTPFVGQADYPVMGVGAIGRWWAPRLQLAGTHDARWRQEQWPKSPLDHDYGYWNCAPADQQVDYPQGGEEIALANMQPPSPAAARLTAPGAPFRFVLPTQDLQLLVRLKVGAMLFAPMHIDTVVIDLGAATLSVVRRAILSARTEVRQLELGTWPRGTGMVLDRQTVREAAAMRAGGRHGQ